MRPHSTRSTPADPEVIDLVDSDDEYYPPPPHRRAGSPAQWSRARLNAHAAVPLPDLTTPWVDTSSSPAFAVSDPSFAIRAADWAFNGPGTRVFVPPQIGRAHV